MKVIQPNCRIQFTADDINFIVTALSRSPSDHQFLADLLGDEDTRDQILDDEALFHSLLELRGCVPVSDHLYFYVMVRHVLREAGILERRVADYVAEILCEFSRQDRNCCTVPGHVAPLDYFFEMVAALKTADERTSFYLRAHIGNHSLFLAGVFPDRIRYRAESKGFPDLSYYEALGQSSYRAAGDHRLAGRYELVPIFSTLAAQFRDARMALNDVAQRLFTLGDTDLGLDSLLLNVRPDTAN
ncbi:MAG: hypothetical protein L0Z50_26850 [Verrucomicrobiales bacterium]|nr:hypothetical protein [Verrucomicrobiales bacterium]